MLMLFMSTAISPNITAVITDPIKIIILAKLEVKVSRGPTSPPTSKNTEV